MWWRRVQYLLCDHFDNNNVRVSDLKGVVLPTHQIMEDTPKSLGHRPQHANPPHQWAHGKKSINFLYTVITSTSVLDHIKHLTTDHKSGEIINTAYELPRMESVVRYLHAAVGLPTKTKWLKSIYNGNYLTWLLITLDNVNTHFLELEETQKGHMWNDRQGVSSTKALTPPVTEQPTKEKNRDVFINVYEPKGTMYTYQTGESTR